MSADFLVTNARVRTGDRARPWASSFAVADGRIVAMDDAAVGPDTVVHDLGGAVVMAGFVDAHNHHQLAGKADLFELVIPTGADVDTLLSTIGAYAATLPEGAWVAGGPWGSDRLDALSSAAVLARFDEVTGGRPAVIIEDSRHNRWANSAAMALAGTAAGDHGVLLDDGRLTGVLLEAAGVTVEQVRRRQAPLSAADEKAASRRGVEILNSYGVTAFQDAAASIELLGALAELDDAGDLNAWVVTSLLVNDEIFGYEPIGEGLVWQGERFRTEHHRPDFIKIFLDGVPPARTGAFLEPYLPDDAHGDHFHGTTLLDPAELYDWLRRTAERGISAKIHCSGDAAARLVLDTVERLRGEGFTDVKYQIAHGQFLSDVDLPRLGALSVTAEISPFIWFPGVIPEAIKTALPAERAEKMQPNRSLIDTGALVAGGSDWPVSESPDAWEGIHGLVTRQDPSGVFPGTLWAEQAITLDEAIDVFTINAARAIGLGAETGSLEVGKSADFIVLDRDPYAVAPTELVTVRVAQTWFAGRRVF